MTSNCLRTALIGCGQIADAHLQELRRVPRATVVAVCDLHIDLARQAATRFDVPRSFDDVSKMLAETRPDVVHITTPPHSHRALAMQCLSAGAHVYVEKPFTVDALEAAEVIAAAEGRGLRVCLGHDQLFDPAWQECAQRVAVGEAGRVVHVEALQAYDLAGPFGRQLQDDAAHWVHRLPGGLFQNVISHALARILAFIPDQLPEVSAHCFTVGGSAFPTELRVLLVGESCTGALTFSTRVRPLHRMTWVFGTRGALAVDLDARTVTVDRTAALPGALATVETTWRRLTQARRHVAANLARMARGDLHYFEGMHTLFGRFYEAILTGGPMPVLHEDALRATRVMDVVFQSCRRSAAGVAGNLKAV
ncbi:MAG TPA: Gfo/Idh/MocA family oxidoreductase [Vicinamibacterales bacterium]|nr:Gfo/Idh/MocA family oxidoreductase [Vicinamibacterales bacterium]